MTSIFIERRDALVAAIREAALANQAMPHNATLAQRLGVREAYVPAVLADAIDAGLIRLGWHEGGRFAQAGDGSWRTARAGNTATAPPPGRSDPMQRAVEYCRQAALRGEKAPSNDAIAAHLGWASTGRASTLISGAQAQGLIRVHRGQTSRVIEAADGSWRTAGAMPAPHWRDRAGAEARP